MATKSTAGTPGAEKQQPAVKPAPNKATPPKPTNPQDVKDIERSDSEGMAQPQGLPPHPAHDADDCCDDKQCDRPNSKRDRPKKR